MVTEDINLFEIGKIIYCSVLRVLCISNVFKYMFNTCIMCSKLTPYRKTSVNIIDDMYRLYW